MYDSLGRLVPNILYSTSNDQLEAISNITRLELPFGTFC